MKVIELNEEEFENNILKSEGKILVDCYADWCGPCQMLSPILEEIAEEITDCLIYKLNVDSARQVCMKYEIMSIPTLLLFKNGNLNKQLVGLHSRDEIIEIINEI